MGWGWKARAVAALMMTLCAAPIAKGDPLAIRIGWVVTPGHLTPLIEALGKRHPELFKHLGKSYTLEAIHFAGTTPQIQALAIKDLDIGAQSPSAFALAVTNAHLDLRAIADVVQDGHEGYFSEYFVVRADGPIKTVEDVKGRRIATNTIGSASDAAMRTMFRRHGVKDADFTTVETNFANMPAMLEGGKVDLIGVLPQFAHGIIGNDKYRVLFRARDAVGPTQAVMWAISADYIAAHRPVLVDFFEDAIRAVRWLTDPAHRDEVIAITADVTKLPKERLDFAFTKEDFYHSPDMRPEIALAQKEIDEFVALGVVPKPVKLEPRYVDLSLIEEAKKRIDGE